MNTLRKIYCRAFQKAFKFALPFLPYRNPEVIKYDSLGMDYSMRNIKPLSETDLLPYKNSMEQAGLQVKIGG